MYNEMPLAIVKRVHAGPLSMAIFETLFYNDEGRLLHRIPMEERQPHFKRKKIIEIKGITYRLEWEEL